LKLVLGDHELKKGSGLDFVIWPPSEMLPATDPVGYF
jgi:hypothetical protein